MVYGIDFDYHDYTASCSYLTLASTVCLNLRDSIAGCEPLPGRLPEVLVSRFILSSKHRRLLLECLDKVFFLLYDTRGDRVDMMGIGATFSSYLLHEHDLPAVEVKLRELAEPAASISMQQAPQQAHPQAQLTHRRLDNASSSILCLAVCMIDTALHPNGTSYGRIHFLDTTVRGYNFGQLLCEKIVEKLSLEGTEFVFPMGAVGVEYWGKLQAKPPASYFELDRCSVRAFQRMVPGSKPEEFREFCLQALNWTPQQAKAYLSVARPERPGCFA